MSSTETIDPANAWHPPHRSAYLGWKLPHMGFGDRLLFRLIGLFGRGQIGSIAGLEHIRPENDPFIVAINHSSRREAILVPTMLFLHRGGRLVHFLADWNPLLIPIIRLIYRRSRVIIVDAKPARPAFLNRFKPYLFTPSPPFETARTALDSGRSVGIFPEGTVNWNRVQLMRGQLGTAKLAVDSGVPVVPIGIRFEDNGRGKLGPMDIRIGAPLYPPAADSPGSSAGRVRGFHALLMAEIGRLSSKSWSATRERVLEPTP